MDMDFSKFRKNLATLIEGRSLSIPEISSEMGMARTTIYRYLSCNRTPDLPNLITLAEYFSVSLDWLIGLSDERFNFLHPEIQDIAYLYEAASPEDRRVIQAVVDKYRIDKE